MQESLPGVASSGRVRYLHAQFTMGRVSIRNNRFNENSFEERSACMLKRVLGTVTLLGLALVFSEVALTADDKDKTEDKDKKEVALPELPKGAGKVDKEAPKTFTETKSGLKYRVLRKTDGKKPKSTQTVKVNYHGWLDNKKVFDSSYKREEPISFPLNRVIPGWTEGMQLVGEGGMIELEIPSDLGYGNRGAPPDIPPKATLHFLVELLEVK